MLNGTICAEVAGLADAQDLGPFKPLSRSFAQHSESARTGWFGISHNAEAHPGGVFRVEVSVGNVARGVYVEVIPHRRVAFSWGWESRDPSLSALPPGSSLVEIDLEPRNGGTLVRTRHSGLPDSLERIHGERWSHHLAQLEAAVLESAPKAQ